MNVLVLGATGRTGKWVVQEALKKGHFVHCLARNTSRIEPHKRLKTFEGNPTNQTDLEQAISHCEAIISVLNVSRKSDFPWSILRTPETFMSDTMKLLTQITKDSSDMRIALCSAWGAGETKKDIPYWFKWFIDNSNIGIAYADHERQEKILSESSVKWTIVQPVGLSNSTKDEKIRESFGNDPKPSLLISRKSLAKYLVDSLERTDLVKQKVVISKG